MFRVYKVKPKVSERIKAIQVTEDQANLIAFNLMGRVITSDTNVRDESGAIHPAGVQFPTLDGVKFCPMGDWIVRHDDATFEIIQNDMFVENWEVARNTNAS